MHRHPTAPLPGVMESYSATLRGRGLPSCACLPVLRASSRGRGPPGRQPVSGCRGELQAMSNSLQLTSW